MLKFANSASEGRWGENKTNWHVSTKFYVMAHFTRHIRPGMKILQTSYGAGDNLYTVAAYSSAGKKLALVTMNDDRVKKYVVYDFSGLKVDGVGEEWLTYMNNSKLYVKVSEGWPVKNYFGTILDPFSIVSFEVSGVELA